MSPAEQPNADKPADERDKSTEPRPKGRQLRRNVTSGDLPTDNGQPPDWEDITEAEYGGPSPHPEKAAWPPRNVTDGGETSRQKWMKAKADEIDRALRIESGTIAPTDNGGFVQRGAGYVIMEMGGPETAPPPMPPEAELCKAAETPHTYPDLVQPPAREEFTDVAAFNEAIMRWLVNVAPTVVRRNKRLERIQLKPGATAKEIADSIRARAKGEAS